MMGVKSIVYEKNNQYFVIDIGENCKLSYRGVFVTVENELVLEYLRILFPIINNWKKEYINTSTIDGQSWKLTILLTNGEKKEYSGYSSFPNNFEAFEIINDRLISEVM